MPAKFDSLLAARRAVVLDGATGTNLQLRGLPRGALSDLWVLENPSEVLRLHREFIEAGSDIILTNSFGGSRVRLSRSGLGERASELNRSAASLARQAAGETALVAGSIGPSGELLKPLGPLDEEDAYNAFFEQATALIEGGVDLIVVETQFDLGEARTALRAVRAASPDIPLICSFSFDRGTRTMMGVRPTALAAEFSGFNLSALGINCGRSLEDNFKVLQDLRSTTDLPIWFKPNAGLPRTDEMGNSFYDVQPEEMGAQVPAWVAAGARLVGGCCGTSPAHVRAIADAARNLETTAPESK